MIYNAFQVIDGVIQNNQMFSEPPELLTTEGTKIVHAPTSAEILDIEKLAYLKLAAF